MYVLCSLFICVFLPLLTFVSRLENKAMYTKGIIFLFQRHKCCTNFLLAQFLCIYQKI